eukprot:UN18655
MSSLFTLNAFFSVPDCPHEKCYGFINFCLVDLYFLFLMKKIE